VVTGTKSPPPDIDTKLQALQAFFMMLCRALQLLLGIPMVVYSLIVCFYASAGGWRLQEYELSGGLSLVQAALLPLGAFLVLCNWASMYLTVSFLLHVLGGIHNDFLQRKTRRSAGWMLLGTFLFMCTLVSWLPCLATVRRIGKDLKVPETGRLTRGLLALPLGPALVNQGLAPAFHQVLGSLPLLATLLTHFCTFGVLWFVFASIASSLPAILTAYRQAFRRQLEAAEAAT
jgi:hypothetical protein